VDEFDEIGFMQILRFLYYGYPVLDVVAGVLCLAYAHVSSRLVVAGIGFLGQAGLFALRQVVNSFHFVDNWQQFELGMTGASLMLNLLIVIGLAMAFGDMARKLRGSRPTAPRRDADEDDDRPAWRRRDRRDDDE
jgi:hypothetical protein